MPDFQLSSDFNDRAGLISFGESIGHLLKQQNRNRPWMIRLDGDFNCGKSLLALAIDKGFRPEAYPDGLDRGVRIQSLMPDWHANVAESLHTVFRNFGPLVCVTKESFDSELKEFEDRNPQARILIVSNLRRSLTGNDFDDGLDSDRLDMAVRVLKTGDQFQRHVDLIAKETGVVYELRTLT